MIFTIGLGIILAAATIVCVPLFRGVPAEVVEGGATGESALLWEKQKRDAYKAIKEADLDLQMGKLGDDEYQAIRTTEEARALEALRALEEENSGGGGKKAR